MSVIDGPLPRAPEFDIWSVAEPISGRWRAGVKLWDYPPEPVYGHDPCAEGGTWGTKSGATASWTNPVFPSFTGYLPVECSTITVDLDTVRRHAEAVFDAREHAIIEQQLLLGDIVSAPFVSDSTLVPALASGAAQPAGIALSYLEQAIGTNTDAKGLILADPATATAWGHLGSVSRVGNQLQTVLGTPVLVSSAFIEQHPDEESAAGAHQSWAYAISGVLAAHGDVSIPDDPVLIEVSTNTFVLRAERDYVVAWDAIGGSSILVDWCDECTVTAVQ